MSMNGNIFWTVYVGAGLFLVFAGLSLIFYLQDPFCAVGVDTVNECWAAAFERLREQASRVLYIF